MIQFYSGAFGDKISGKTPDSARCTDLAFFIYCSIHFLFFLNMSFFYVLLFCAATTMKHNRPHEPSGIQSHGGKVIKSLSLLGFAARALIGM